MRHLVYSESDRIKYMKIQKKLCQTHNDFELRTNWIDAVVKTKKILWIGFVFGTEIECASSSWSLHAYISIAKIDNISVFRKRNLHRQTPNRNFTIVLSFRDDVFFVCFDFAIEIHLQVKSVLLHFVFIFRFYFSPSIYCAMWSIGIDHWEKTQKNKIKIRWQSFVDESS